MLCDIGLAAERLLLGCLDTNVASRWSIALADEVAWGIGWVSHDSSPASDEEPVPMHNRTRPISAVISDSNSDCDSSPHPYDIIPEESLLPGRGSHDSSSSPRWSSSRSSSTFDDLNLEEDLLRGIYAYS